MVYWFYCTSCFQFNAAGFSLKIMHSKSGITVIDTVATSYATHVIAVERIICNIGKLFKTSACTGIPLILYNIVLRVFSTIDNSPQFFCRSIRYSVERSFLLIRAFIFSAILLTSTARPFLRSLLRFYLVML